MSVPETSLSHGRRAAILLSAGASTRFGGTPKALALLDGEPVLARQVRLAREAGFSPVVGVVGAHARQLEGVLKEGGALSIDHPDWSSGRTGSVQAGLTAIAGADEALVWPVDVPFVELATLERLAAAGERDLVATWIVPEYEGRGGHPVLIKRPVWPQIQRLSSSAPLRSLVPGLGAQVLRVRVSDPGVVGNIDTQEAFAEALSQWHQRRGPP